MTAKTLTEEEVEAFLSDLRAGGKPLPGVPGPTRWPADS